jgi:hypothetical protein
MNPLLKSILAVVAGIIIGGTLNMGIIMISGSVIPPPEGVDLTTMEGLKANMHLLEPKHFIMPFLAHALGTFLGALIAGLIVPAQKMKLAMIVGGWFLLGGIINILMLPSPLWFTLTDLIGAYLPMAYLGAKLITKKEN